MKIKTKNDRRRRIKLRLRKRMLGTESRPRLTVFRSLNHIYAQAVDDLQGVTIAAASSRDAEFKTAGKRSGNREGAAVVGALLAKRLKEKGITKVVFDRNGFLYHGRLRSMAEGARKAGLEF